MNETERMSYVPELDKEAEAISREILHIFQGKEISYAQACEALDIAKDQLKQFSIVAPEYKVLFL